MPYCGSTSLVKTVPTHKTIYCLRCRSWGCEECAPARASQLRAQAKHGQPTRFLTLTIRFNEGDNPHQAARQLARAWRLVRARMVKKYKLKTVQFLAVWEATKRGAPHLHIFLRGRYISQQWLSEQMDDLIGSPIVHIEKINNKDKAASYVTKYITKANMKFEGCKRYWSSQGYDLRPKKPKGEDSVKADWTQSGVDVFQTIQMLIETYGGAAYPSRFYWTYVPPWGQRPPEEALASSGQSPT